jgi:hypothetical protein
MVASCGESTAAGHAPSHLFFRATVASARPSDVQEAENEMSLVADNLVGSQMFADTDASSLAAIPGTPQYEEAAQEIRENLVANGAQRGYAVDAGQSPSSLVPNDWAQMWRE